MIGRQVVPGHTHVNVVGQMPAGIERYQPRPGQQRLLHVVGCQATIITPRHAPVLGNGPQAIEYPPLGHPGEPPKDEVAPPPAGEEGEAHGHDELSAKDGCGQWSTGAFGEGLQQNDEVLPTGDADGVTKESTA